MTECIIHNITGLINSALCVWQKVRVRYVEMQSARGALSHAVVNLYYED